MVCSCVSVPIAESIRKEQFRVRAAIGVGFPGTGTGCLCLSDCFAQRSFALSLSLCLFLYLALMLSSHLSFSRVRRDPALIDRWVSAVDAVDALQMEVERC